MIYPETQDSEFGKKKGKDCFERGDRASTPSWIEKGGFTQQPVGRGQPGQLALPVRLARNILFSSPNHS